MEIGSVADWFSGVASAVAVVVALGGYWFSERQRGRDRRDRELEAGNMIGVKLSNALNRTDDIRRHICAPYNGPLLLGHGADQLWRKTRPLLGLTEDTSVNLTDAETNLLIRAGQHQFMMDLMLVISRYQSINNSMREYQIRYDAILALLPAPREVNEQVGVHMLEHVAWMKLQPYSNSLEALIQGLKSMAQENVDKAKGLAPLYSPIMKAHFKTDKFLSLGVLPAPAD
jgi:hypothetical protein